MKRLDLLLACFLLLTSVSAAQVDRAAFYSFGEPLIAETAVFPCSSADSIDLVIMLKFQADAIDFKQNPRDPVRNKFYGIAQSELLIRDGQGIIKKRFVQADTVYARSYEMTVSKKVSYGTSGKVRLPAGQYQVEVRFENKARHQGSEAVRIAADSMKIKAGLSYSDAFFCEKLEAEKIEDLEPFVLGKKIPFSASGARIIIPYRSAGEEGNMIYRLRSTGEGTPVDISGAVSVRKGVTPVFASDKYTGDLKFSMDRYGAEPTDMLDMELPGEKLFTGSYVLEVFRQGSADSISLEIDVEWNDRPLALKETKYAIELTYYTLTDEQYAAMTDGSAEENKRAFEAYWKKQDPTPSTPFNEAQFQYFSRVDYAFFNFQTLAEKDGAKSDRGKVYILNGFPSSVGDDFVDGKNRVIWEYAGQKKKYMFDQVSSGVFRLVKVEDI